MWQRAFTSILKLAVLSRAKGGVRCPRRSVFCGRGETGAGIVKQSMPHASAHFSVQKKTAQQGKRAKKTVRQEHPSKNSTKKA